MKRSKSLNCLLTEESSEFNCLNRSKSLLNVHLNVNSSWFPAYHKLIRSKSLTELIIHEDHSHQSSCKHVNKQTSMFEQLIDDHNLPKSISDDFFNVLMRLEKNRLRTFKNWPVDFVTPEELSKAGFYYLLHSDQVKCFECKITLFNWEFGDQAIIEHYKNNPKCKLINGYDVGNFAIDKTPLQVLSEHIDLDEFKHVEPTETILNFDDQDDDDDSIELECNSMRYESQKPVDTRSTTFDDLLYLMRKEENRLKTYDNWPKHLINKVKPADLAQCGFFYTTIRDKVICAFCQVPAWDWASTDIPIKEHYKHNPECPLLNDEDCGNEPIKNIKFKELVLECRDVPPCYSSSYSDEDEISFQSTDRLRPASDEQNNSPNLNHNLEELKNISRLISKHKHADKFYTYQNRLDTFQNWPVDSVKKTHLADAGFYYLGFKDQVKCFSCELSLANWSNLDNPWIEHCRYQKNCEYLKLTKGNEYINRNSKLKDLPSKPSEVVCCGSTASSASSNSSSDIEHTDIEHENEGSLNLFEDTKNVCKICMTKAADIVYLPCLHLASCGSCAIAMRDCPLCKKNILSTMKVYIS